MFSNRKAVYLAAATACFAQVANGNINHNYKLPEDLDDAFLAASANKLRHFGCFRLVVDDEEGKVLPMPAASVGENSRAITKVVAVKADLQTGEIHQACTHKSLSAGDEAQLPLLLSDAWAVLNKSGRYKEDGNQFTARYETVQNDHKQQVAVRVAASTPISNTACYHSEVVVIKGGLAVLGGSMVHCATPQDFADYRRLLAQKWAGFN